MQPGPSVRLKIKLTLSDAGETPPLQAYAFTLQGKLFGSEPLQDGAAAIEVPADLDGRMLEVILGPRPEKGQPLPTAAALKRMGAYASPTRVLGKSPVVELQVPSRIFPHWCLCFVRGRLVKRFTLPDGSLRELPVCNARVHICEVDRIPWVIEKIPDRDILRLRDDLLDKLRVWPPIPPIPDPGPQFGRGPVANPGSIAAQQQTRFASPMPAAPAPVQQRALTSMSTESVSTTVAALATTRSVQQIRSQLVELSSLILIHLCDLVYLWPWFRVDCLATVDTDCEGRFSTLVFHDCADQPDLYLWVEQFQDGAWTTVYRPSVGCGTHWNYACGSEIVINLPRAVACEEPPYDVPPGVTLFVLPYAIGNAPIWGIPTGSPPAPGGWVRPDGMIDYVDTESSALGWLYNAPFGGTLNFIHDDSYFIPTGGVKYYRYSWRRHGTTANTGADDPGWTPISTFLARYYRMEYSDRLPTYESYVVGPFTQGMHSGLFEFKPQDPPKRASDPTTVVAREWISGNVSEVAASWNTLQAAPPLSTDNASDDAGDFDIKLEVFDKNGNQVTPGPGTFRFLARNADGATTRLSTTAEEAGGAYVLRVHVDNNGTTAELPQPSIGGVAASDDCGFLRYQTGDLVHLQYKAMHPNQHAVFTFSITRGSHEVSSTATLPPYVEVAAPGAPTASAPYIKSGDYYQRDFKPNDLTGTCINAAFAANLSVFAKVTDGYRRRWQLDTGGLIAFALAEQHAEPHP